MNDMQVLFLALGGTRKRAVVEDSAQVVADGGTATVVINQAQDWRRERFAADVQVVRLSHLELRHFPMWIEQLVLVRGPRFAFLMAARGPLSGWVGRAGKAYQRRIAGRVHRRMFLPVYRRVWSGAPQRLLQRHLLQGPAYDLLVVTDPASMPAAARLVQSYVARKAAPPRVTYGLAYVLSEGESVATAG